MENSEPNPYRSPANSSAPPDRGDAISELRYSVNSGCSIAMLIVFVPLLALGIYQLATGSAASIGVFVWHVLFIAAAVRTLAWTRRRRPQSLRGVRGDGWLSRL